MYEVKLTKRHGRGLYATKTVAAGEIIEVNHCAVGDSSGTLTERYCFEYSGDLVCIALGNISLVNHSAHPNAEVHILENDHFPKAVLKAVKQIKAGTQIHINYGYKPKGD